MENGIRIEVEGETSRLRPPVTLPERMTFTVEGLNGTLSARPELSELHGFNLIRGGE